MSDFDSDRISVGDLFEATSFYRVPSYQRPFSWDKDNFDDLIDDIVSADKSATYFLGTVVWHVESGNCRAIVDGQQRITSLLVLIACLRDIVQDEGVKSELHSNIQQPEVKTKQIPSRLRITVKDSIAFDKIVASQGGTLNSYAEKDFSEPEWRYVVASRSFHEKLKLLSQENLEELTQFILGKCTLIFLSATSFEDAFRLFEIVNDRGKQLRRIDVLKSKNISPDVIPQNEIRDQVAAKWESLESELGERNFESVFFLLRLILVKDKPQSDILTEFEKRVFDAGLVGRGKAFTDLLFDYVKLYREIFVDQNYIDSSQKDGIRFQSLMFIMDAEFSASEWRACVLQFAKKFQRNEFFQFCLAIEKLYLTHWTNNVRKDERYIDYTNVLKAIELSDDPKAVVASVPSNPAAILAEITRKNVYKAGFCKYALLRLELVTSEHDVPKRLSARSIEHVFPQAPATGSEWEKLAGGAKLEDFVHSIGNLVLISKSRNSSASNHDFEEKKKKYLKPRVSDYPRSLQILGYSEWTPDVIKKRTQEVGKIFLDDI